MGLLDELKQQAAAARETADLAKAAQARADALRAVALPALFRIHQSLSELVEQLRVLGREAPATLKIPALGEVAGFMQGGYEVFADAKPPTTVTFRCNLRYQRNAPLEVKPTGPVTAWVEAVRRQGLQAKIARMLEASGPRQRAYVVLEGTVPATIQIKLDLEQGALQIYTRNFDELQDRRQYFNPAAVNGEWCEELLKFVLRKEHRFMQHEVAADVRDQLRRRLEWEKLKETTGREPEGAAPGRLKNLFKRAPQLKLRYQGRTWDLAGREGVFTLGRVADCDVNVRDARVSRFHARVELRDDEYVLVDDSSNGTHVRFADGREETLKRTSVVLDGKGFIGLGSPPSPDNPLAIEFEA